jgi:hypothetical protein
MHLHLNFIQWAAVVVLLAIGLAITSMRVAIELGPARGEHYRDAARIYAASSRNAAVHLDTARQWFMRAVESGFDPASIEQDPQLASEQAFVDLARQFSSRQGNGDKFPAGHLADSAPVPSRKSMGN